MQCVNKRRKLSKVNRNNDTDTRASTGNTDGGHARRLEKLQAMSDVGGYGHEKRIFKEREERKRKGKRNIKRCAGGVPLIQGLAQARTVAAALR